jgi:hypothetical protein
LQEGYIRTSSYDFTLNVNQLKSREVHLTNDAVQKKCQTYGKYEVGNKLDFATFQSFLSEAKIVDRDDYVAAVLVPKMQELVFKSIEATADLLNPRKRRYCFELLGYDFMLDKDLNVYLIEVNMNPCLDLASPVQQQLIPAVIEATIALAIDPLFPRPHPSNKHGARLRSTIRASKESAFVKVYPKASVDPPRPPPKDKEVPVPGGPQLSSVSDPSTCKSEAEAPSDLPEVTEKPGLVIASLHVDTPDPSSSKSIPPEDAMGCAKEARILQSEGLFDCASAPRDPSLNQSEEEAPTKKSGHGAELSLSQGPPVQIEGGLGGKAFLKPRVLDETVSPTFSEGRVQATISVPSSPVRLEGAEGGQVAYVPKSAPR